MGKVNVVINEYLSDDERFADLINVGIFRGKQVVMPEELMPLDTKIRQIENIASQDGCHEYARDQFRQWKCGKNNVIFGVEPEDSIHYALPVKYMKYDSIQYQDNYLRIAKEHRKRKDLSKKEFISRFSKKDSLVPTITLGLYCGESEWDAPLSLHQMLNLGELSDEVKDMLISSCNDYRANILCVHELESSDMFVTDLREVFGFLMRQKDKKKLRQYVRTNEYFHHMRKDAYNVIVVLSGIGDLRIKIEDRQTGGGVDMCKAIDDLMKDAMEEGVGKGIEQGMDRINRLNIQLAAEGRTQDMIRAAGDFVFQRKLMRKYRI